MCIPFAVASLALTAASGAMAANAQMQQGKEAQRAANANAKMAEAAAQDAQARGEQEAIEVQRRGAAIKGAQKVSLASKGLDLGYGTADDLQSQTDFFTQADVATTRTNANKEAWRLRSGGYQDARAGAFARQQGNMQAAGTMLSTAGSVANKWYETRGA